MDSSLMQCELFDGPEHDMLSGKTSLEPSVLTPAQTLRQWLEKWQGYALTYRTVDGETPEFCSGRPDWSSGPFWMRNGSEFRSGAVASSLSEILETGPIDRRYFLTPKACRGILRRAEKRGKTLPAALQRTLTAVADVVAVSIHENQRGELSLNEISGALNSGGGKPGQGYSAVMVANTLNGNSGRRQIEETLIPFHSTGDGYWQPGAGTLRARGQESHEHLIASTGAISHCLNAGGMGRIDYETETMVIGSLTTKHTSAGQLIPCLTSNDDAHSGFRDEHGLIPIAFEPRFVRNGRGAPDEIVSPLKARSGEDGRGDGATCIATESAVRRLTPLECERLQGFSDRHTDIGRADGPRYKALGNSMAVPVIRHIGRRIIAAHYPTAAQEAAKK